MDEVYKNRGEEENYPLDRAKIKKLGSVSVGEYLPAVPIVSRPLVFHIVAHPKKLKLKKIPQNKKQKIKGKI